MTGESVHDKEHIMIDNIKYPEAATQAQAAIAPLRAWLAIGGYGHRGILANQALDDFVYAISGDLDTIKPALAPPECPYCELTLDDYGNCPRGRCRDKTARNREARETAEKRITR